MFQQDGAPPHYPRGVTGWLNANLPRWIGNREPIHWPARSSDLTPLDFFVWPFVKNLVYQQQSATRQELQGRIINEFGKITLEMIRNVHENVVGRLRRCIEVQWGHF